MEVTHDHTRKYLWDEDGKTVDMKSDQNNTIVDTENDHSELETDQNNNNMNIQAFGPENAIYWSSTNEWEEFVGELDFDDIAASAGHDKPQK